MITKCYSYSGNCPCIKCNKNCCADMGNKTDTEKLCNKAKEYCESMANKNNDLEA